MPERDIIKFRILLFSVVLCLVSISYAEDIGSVISFYLDNLDYVFNRNYIFKSDSGFSCNVRSILATTDYRGRPDKIDTTVVKLFFSKGKLDSSKILDSAEIKENILPSDFLPQQVWHDSLKFDFYPNDTGSGTLAIGFESNSMDSSDAVVGFVNLNRTDYYIEELFLYYPRPEKYEGISRIYIFDRSGDFILLRHYELQTSKVLFLGRQYFKQTFDFSEYQFK
jgi:hypothetical protein